MDVNKKQPLSMGYKSTIMVKDEMAVEPAVWIDKNAYVGYKRPRSYGAYNSHEKDGKA